ncbi:Nif3-like dinuclear metal center hexameric protein [Metabacillus malikii]|uniref:GTP cyclohydrolase 1 type 2 homolog n=1 Tax=Metabacillus malikii TaxID=1504265 RepID=A0ABT9ZDX6_9BACI|nr:Nif3-like dinuclear metal center hexameric protein [Metabacillus malikii]MDQ0230016.1 putative NIF3 family GTP cyclohydrolase 1 type 2 [Metabacillus malikii]
MISIQDVIDEITKPVKKIVNTVDGLLYGEVNESITGIIVTFVASQYVLKKSTELDANLIITHEGIFYSHHAHNPLQDYKSFIEKQRFIKDSNIAIYRLHDYIHHYQPDIIMLGLLKSLELDKNNTKHFDTSAIVTVPTTTVGQMANQIKQKLEIPYVRIIGDIEMTCSKIGFLVGYRGGSNLAIPLFENEGVELIIAGEGPEWETPEYVRDANEQGRNKALILIGHAASEEPGMEYLVELLKEKFNRLPVHFVKEKPIINVF